MLAETLGDHESFTDRVATLMPDPDKPIVSVAEFVALLEIASDPFIARARSGTKLTVTAADWPGGKVAGVVSPFTVKEVPLTPSFEITRFAVPEFVSRTDCEPIAPSKTSPNEMLVALTLKMGAAATAVPVSGITIGDAEAFVVIETFPEEEPVAVGARITATLMDAPGAIAAEVEGPMTVNPFPLVVSE